MYYAGFRVAHARVCLIVGKLARLDNIPAQGDDALRLHLLVGAKDMRIILGESSGTHQPLQRTMLRIPIAPAKLCTAYRQGFIRA